MATRYKIVGGPDRMSLMMSVFDYGAKVPSFTLTSEESPDRLVLAGIVTGVARRLRKAGNHRRPVSKSKESVLAPVEKTGCRSTMTQPNHMRSGCLISETSTQPKRAEAGSSSKS